MSERRRILVLGNPDHPGSDLYQPCQADAELVHTDSLARGCELLRREKFDAILIDNGDPNLYSGAGNFLQSKHILQTLADGVAVVGIDLRIQWANTTFEAWCGGPTLGRGFYEALGSPAILGPDYYPLHTALDGKPVTTRLHCSRNRYLDLHITPVLENESRVSHLIALCRDVTAEVQQQQKLDALHRAGRELAALAPEQLAEMGPEERIEVLKQNIRRFTHDLLHYDVIEIRLLDRLTGRLEPLLAEGMSPEAAQRILFPDAKNNGVTGFVAATGKSYLCPDITNDPLYIQGALNARSSLTVPLIYQDQVIGTFNVESPKPNAFGEDQLQFAEIFSREIADALHTLELLSAEKRSTATQSVDAISREVAMPVDEILTAATGLLDRYIGHEHEMADKLKQILKGARSIKQSIQKVGDHIAPPSASCHRQETSPSRLRGMRILVADNDERVRRSAHNILGRWGCVVETARDGQEALTMARLGNYDTILADIRLPDLTGYEVFRRLREAQPQARVILMTAFGYDPSHSLVKARQEGLRFILYKPFRVEQLVAALENSEPAPCNSALAEVRVKTGVP